MLSNRVLSLMLNLLYIKLCNKFIIKYNQSQLVGCFIDSSYNLLEYFHFFNCVNTKNLLFKSYKT